MHNKIWDMESYLYPQGSHLSQYRKKNCPSLNQNFAPNAKQWSIFYTMLQAVNKAEVNLEPHATF